MSSILVPNMNINGSVVVHGGCPATDTPVSVAAAARTSRNVQRQISAEAGRGLEILGHAIEYLTDEFVCEGRTIAEDNGRLGAIQILMGLNRQIYFSCPIKPTLGERFRSWMGPILN